MFHIDPMLRLCNNWCMSQQHVRFEIPRVTLGDRMRMSLRQAGVGVQEMADYLEVGRNSVSRWINDRGEPSKQTRRLWAFRCGVPLEWLETGQAPVEGPGPDGARTGGFEPPTFWSGVSDLASYREARSGATREGDVA